MTKWTDIHWYTILILAVGIVISAAIGAIIQAAISAARNKKPAIGRRVDLSPTFEDTVGASRESNPLTISDGNTQYKYNQLHIAQIELANQGTQDFDKFELGIALDKDDVAVYVEAQLPSRHHHLEQLTSPTFDDPKSNLDFILHPLNRGDAYALRVLILTPEGKQKPGEINFSSPLPVRFTDLSKVGEMVEEAASRASLALGPLSISFNK